MKQKIFQSLKQEYSSLGLGDAVIEALAESLSQFVNDGNMAAVVTAQKPYLEAMQRANDKRATDAAAKAKAEAEAKAKLAAELAAKELKEAKALAAKFETEARGQVQPQWIGDLQDKVSKLVSDFEAVKKENDDYRAQLAAMEREAFINSEAARLGVPEWRVSEGFNIAADADNGAITEYLSKVANNVKVNTLPKKEKSFATPSVGNVNPEEVSALADKLLKY